MCGIAGFITPEHRYMDARATVRAMCDAIRHRGPDDAGYFVAGDVALGMRRLSIIDVAGGQQPIANEDGSVRVVFNGEIYNFRALRTRLQRNGHHLTSSSDTETLVHLYEELGDDFVHELRGMFGFALWDSRRERLLVARDRLGIKPIYYWPRPDRGFAFASELRALLTLPDFTADLSPTAVGNYFALGYVPHQQAIFAGVHKLPPGHLLSWDRANGLTVKRYWTPVRAEQSMRDEREAIDELRRLIDESVLIHLESEVPLGAFLSGGIDSSTVVASMQRQMPQPVRTFSIGFRERAFDESGYAAEVAAKLGTQHTELIVEPDADQLVDEVVRAFDEPFADASALPTYLVSQLARRHVTVALSGDGGDELFGGYTRYAETLNKQPIGSESVRDALRGVARRLPHATPWRNRLLNAARTARGRYASTVALALDSRDGGVLRTELARQLPSMDALLGRYFDEARDSGRDFATQLMLVDAMSYLPDDILTKVDRMSMAPSLEARVPLLDHVVAEFAFSLPTRLKMRGGESKWLLRRVIDGSVPATVLNRPKMGFGVPLGRWFRHELAHRVEALRDAQSPIYEYVDAQAVSRVIGEHMVRRRDHSTLLWRLLVFSLWRAALGRGDLSRPNRSTEGVELILSRAVS
ncbi:MAG: asparagine synthase (glutamine-hydrolyzing) [Gemmatimonadaceae bacterium]